MRRAGERQFRKWTRSLGRGSLLVLCAALTLAIGMGADTHVFSIASPILTRPTSSLLRGRIAVCRPHKFVGPLVGHLATRVVMKTNG